MTTQSFLIGPPGEGLRRDLKPWATPDDSFKELTNAYQWRGRVVRRSGYRKLGRLANGTPVMGLRTYENFGIGLQTLVAFDTTDAYEWNGTTFVVLPSVMPVTWSGTDYQFFYTVNYANAFWATNSKPGLQGVNISGAVAGVGITTITTTTPHGFSNGQTVVIINITSTATDGQDDLNGNSYIITVTGANTFTIPFMTTSTYASGGIALNSEVSVAGRDGIRYYGQLSNGTGWANYNPPISTTVALAGALLIFPYRGYLVFLNTYEGNDGGVVNFGNRARWTQIGTPYYSPPQPIFPSVEGIDINTARDDLFGRGGANDAPTNEVIVAAAFIQDILVVYFERSTWRLRFVNNTQNPFSWERINIELGADCTFSSIPFDNGLMAIGNRGIVICDTNDTVRFDEKIPDAIFDIRQANHGLERVYGIRTFRTKLNYWTYPSSDNPTGTFPDKVLVFNYETKNWSFFDDCYTCFGYFYETGTGFTWGDLTEAWSSYGNISWNSGVSQTGYEYIVAGNQQGYVLQLQEPTEGSYCVNDPSLSISAINSFGGGIPSVFTSVNNNLPDQTWITLSGITGTTSDDGVSLNGRNFIISKALPTDNDFTLSEFKPINGGNASGTSYTATVGYVPIIPGSVQINIGSLVFTDPNLDGVLVESASLGSGTIDYSTGLLSLIFNPAIGSTQVNIRVVTYNAEQGLNPVSTIGVYGGGGEIAKISDINIISKIFNFFKDDRRARLSKIDFYVDRTTAGQFTCNVLADSSNSPINTPLPDNPQSNIVLTSANPYQIAQGDQAIYRLFCDAIAQTVQLQFTFSDQQLAVNAINQSDIDISALIITMRQGGRLV